MTNNKPRSSLRTRTLASGKTVHDVRWRHEGKAHARTFPTRSEAKTFADLLGLDGHFHALQWLEQGVNGATLAQFAPTYLTEGVNVSPSTLKRYQAYLANSILPALGPIPLERINSGHIQRWLLTLEGSSPKTIRNYHAFLAAMLGYAKSEGHISSNPCALTRLPDATTPAFVALTPSEFWTIYDFIPDAYKTLVLTLVSTGMRWGEASALQGRDLDAAGNTITVSRAWHEGENRTPVLGPPKTAAGHRTISISPDLTTLLATRANSAGAEGLLFQNARGHRIKNTTFVAKIWNPTLRMANGLPAIDYVTAPHADGPWQREPAESPINKWPRVHDLRHTHASWLLEEGVEMDVIKQRLGHESIKMTIDRYSHVAPTRGREAAEAANRALLTSVHTRAADAPTRSQDA
jgi:integrase